MDLSGPAGPPDGQQADPRPGPAAGGGEPGLGIPPGPRRADPPRPPCQPGDRPADPPLLALPARSPRPGYLMAGIPACPGGGVPLENRILALACAFSVFRRLARTR